MKKFTHVSDDVSKNDYTGSWIRVDITLSALHIQVKHKLAGFKKKKRATGNRNLHHIYPIYL